MPELVAAGCGRHGRRAISFFTAFTPLTRRAMLSAVALSVAFLAKPDSITVPLSVSTLIYVASTDLFSTKRPLICVVIVASSM